MVNEATLEIIAVVIGKGKSQDCPSFKQRKIKAGSEIEVLADKGYQGIKKYDANSKTPAKKQRKSNLNHEDKRDNRKLAKLRIKVEHIIRCLKIFRILSIRYRNKRKRFGLRVNLIAAIYNCDQKLAK